ncbi:MAG: hypothetical protein AAGI07_08720 [Bacteroidota bacterium]
MRFYIYKDKTFYGRFIGNLIQKKKLNSNFLACNCHLVSLNKGSNYTISIASLEKDAFVSSATEGINALSRRTNIFATFIFS